ncbi:AraC family transcriptional regulator [Ruminococcus gauvreauii]|uniref:AraC family transcriptional regulator n=1 Tax=Ruminococcus gauvreauii TaxID=438033 RepID=A0ABY5VE75_9FIRM|nr:AraC family transcriptional regulator [Ruminococcus gauvreauii]UWP58561.1 AraC family transcriptional regulator [Ruminococcus gauvreauii]
MIQCFAKNSFTPSFKDGKMPRLLSASHITIGFSQHSRILHNHKDRLELLFIRTGSGSYVVDDEYYDVKAGNIIICNAGVLHDEVPQYNRELSMLSIAIDNLQLEGLPENHLISADIKPVLKVEKHFVLMDAIFQTIFDSVAFDSEEQQETNQYLTQALLSLLIHAFKQYGQPNTEHSKEDPLLKDIKQYIDENYSEDLTLQKISDQFFISPSYLSHLFKRKLGYSPIHYIVRRRIGEAQSLLIMSQKSITEIASMVGFDNLSHFNVQFKKYVGLSPLSYRKKYTLRDPSDELTD